MILRRLLATFAVMMALVSTAAATTLTPFDQRAIEWSQSLFGLFVNHDRTSTSIH